MKIRIGKDSAMYCIAPSKARDGDGYSVSIKRQGLVVSKRFAIRLYPDQAAALAAAQAWRDRVLAVLPPMTSHELRTVVRRNNKSGVPGVYRSTDSNSGGTYWIGRTYLGEKSIARKFSVAKYGEEGARQQAIAAREKMLTADPARYTVPTGTGQALSVMTFGDPKALRSSVPLVWDSATKARWLARLQAEGLIASPTPKRPVGFSLRRTVPPVAPTPRWCAQWRDEAGRVHIRTFSVEKHGEAEAERLAREVFSAAMNQWRVANGFEPLPPDSEPSAR